MLQAQRALHIPWDLILIPYDARCIIPIYNEKTKSYEVK